MSEKRVQKRDRGTSQIETRVEVVASTDSDPVLVSLSPVRHVSRLFVFVCGKVVQDVLAGCFDPSSIKTTFKVRRHGT